MTNRVREINRTFSDKEVHSVFVAMEKGWDTHNHLVYKDAQCPPVYCVVMTITNQHLRG